LATSNWLVAAVIVPLMLAAYGFRIGAEEQMLRDAFGEEYARYRGRTWRLIPFLYCPSGAGATRGRSDRINRVRVRSSAAGPPRHWRCLVTSRLRPAVRSAGPVHSMRTDCGASRRPALGQPPSESIPGTTT